MVLAEIKKYWGRYLVGSLIGIGVFLLFCIVYHRNELPDGFQYQSCNLRNSYSLKAVKDSTKNTIYTSIELLKDKDIEILNGKINTLNSRFNDLYLFAGIIITLLLAINISIYIKTGNEVDRHMNENYKEYANRIGEIKEEVERIKEEAESYLDQIKGVSAASKLSKGSSPQNIPD